MTEPTLIDRFRACVNAAPSNGNVTLTCDTASKLLEAEHDEIFFHITDEQCPAYSDDGKALYARGFIVNPDLVWSYWI